jgi:hypothetical protein
VQTCASPPITTNLFKKNVPPPDSSLAPPNNTVTLPAQVYDTASITGALGTPTGSVTYSLWTDSQCSVVAASPTFPGGGNTATGDDRAGRHDPQLAHAHVRHTR